MARININVGTNANDGTGDDLRAAMQKINTNFTELYGTTAEANDLIEDGSPQLGGNLDVNGYTITSASNGNISIVPNGTGTLTLNALKVNGTTISSDDSSKITLAEAVDITGTLTTPTASVTGTLTTPTASVTGTLTTPNLIVNNISSSDSTVVQINDGLNISGGLTVGNIELGTIKFTRDWSDASTRFGSTGKAGDVPGLVAFGDDYMYACFGTYDGSTQIWKRAALSTF
jgi:hypothetical protein